MRSTCPSSLSLSSITTATEPEMGPHDSGGNNFSFQACQRCSPQASESNPKISTLAVSSSRHSSSSASTIPPSTTTAPLTAQHAWSVRLRVRLGIRFHRGSPRSNLHASLDALPSVNPPHTTSPGGVRSHSFAPSRATLHTPVSRHAPATTLCSATMAHISGRAKTREMARSARARRVVGGIADECECSVLDAHACCGPYLLISTLVRGCRRRCLVRKWQKQQLFGIWEAPRKKPKRLHTPPRTSVRRARRRQRHGT
jgi:hypothetical protein